MDITEFIKACVSAFIANRLAPSAYEINNGQCEDFAEIITRAGFGSMLWQDQLCHLTSLTWEEYEQEISDYCHHCFIMYNNKFYDAECPEGVFHPKDLPLFSKHIKAHPLTREEISTQ